MEVIFKGITEETICGKKSSEISIFSLGKVLLIFLGVINLPRLWFLNKIV